MGIVIVNKRKFGDVKKKPKIALVLAGGALSGGAYKLGGLCALNSFLRNIKINDFDIYTGISAGAFLISPIAGGIPPEEMVKSLYGLSEKVPPFSPFDFYYPNLNEMITKGLRLFFDFGKVFFDVVKSVRNVFKKNKKLNRLLRNFVEKPGYNTAIMLLTPFVREFLNTSSVAKSSTYLISGFFSNKRLEQYIRKVLIKNRIPNNFRLLKKGSDKSLYIIAADLNEAEPVVFGWDEDQTLSISEAVQASTALPVLYKPARIANREFVDAAVVKTAYIELSAEKGADLIIAYNPFRPIVSSAILKLHPDYNSMGDMGLIMILNQALRLLLHSRMMLSIENLKKSPDFNGDIIVFEPMETDSEFFITNPFAFWKLAPSARHGFESVKSAIEENYDILKPIFYNYGIETDIYALKKEFESIKESKLEDHELIKKMGQPKVARKLKHLRAVK